MLRVVCFKWRPRAGYRSQFSAETVNTLRRMVERHYHAEHEFVCITDDPRDIDPRVRVIPLWRDHATLINPWNAAGPSCYRRLKAFSPEAAEIIGPRFVVLDLDCVITGDLEPVWNRTEDFVIWGDTAKGTPYNGSMWLLRAGTRTRVWTDFNPNTSPYLGKRKGYIGSDQAWVAVALGSGEATWTNRDGVYSFRNEIERGRNGLPADARIVFFHGKHDPWHRQVQEKHPWVKEHYR